MVLLTKARGVALVVLSVALGGCTVDGSVGGSDSSGGDDGSGTEGAASSDDSATGDSGTTAATAGGSGGTSAGTDPPTAGGGSTTTAADTEGLPAVCHPVPDDTICSECRKLECCDALHECLAHDTCLCWWDCRHEGHSVDACGELCGSDGALYDVLDACVVERCDACAA